MCDGTGSGIYGYTSTEKARDRSGIPVGDPLYRETSTILRFISADGGAAEVPDIGVSGTGNNTDRNENSLRTLSHAVHHDHCGGGQPPPPAMDPLWYAVDVGGPKHTPP